VFWAVTTNAMGTMSDSQLRRATERQGERQGERQAKGRERLRLERQGE
jgi:hypothetical protein